MAIVFSILPAAIQLLAAASSADAAAVGAVHRRAAAAPLCDRKGWDKDTKSYDDFSKLTLSACAQKCKGDAKCKSFGFSDGACFLYTATLEKNLDADSDSPYKFYDVSCSVPSDSSSASATPSRSPSSSPTALTSRASGSGTASSSNSRSSSSSAAAVAAATQRTSSPSASATPSRSSGSGGGSSSSTSTPSKAATASSSSSSTATASSSIALPSGCSGTDIPNTYTVSSFSWFNSSSNLDCVNGGGDAMTCIKSGAGGSSAVTCDPSKESGCTCGINACSTGLPLQPLGYGPPDRVDFTIDGYGSCAQTNPQSYRRWDVGNGNVGCGTAQNILNFYGNSNSPSSTGRVEFKPGSRNCGNGNSASPIYTASFPVQCTYDAGRNATCTTTLPFKVTLSGFA